MSVRVRGWQLPGFILGFADGTAQRRDLAFGHVFGARAGTHVPIDEDQRRSDCAYETDKDAQPHPTRRMAGEGEQEGHQRDKSQTPDHA